MFFYLHVRFWEDPSKTKVKMLTFCTPRINNKYHKILHVHCRAPEDGYYTFMFSAREYSRGNRLHAVIQRVSASDPNDITSLCGAAEGDNGWQSASCSVSYIALKNTSIEGSFIFLAILSYSIYMCIFFLVFTALSLKIVV